ncbi:MAG TPA: FAD-dependent oxidoreductase [Dermatophilaceae bacterium]|nr:FAD-dependent oxidoreductase [Dermatophilaceae bacterium]
MRTIIVGGVAGGMSAATRLRRLDETADILVLERGEHVSFANCGLPYYVGSVIARRDDLLLQTPASLGSRFGLDVRVRHEVVAIDTAAKTVTVRALDATGPGEEGRDAGELVERYDHLILSLGASPVVPPIVGIQRAMTLRNVSDVDRLAAATDRALLKGRSAVVIGAGFIGVEVAENLWHRGLHVTVMELAEQVMPPLDPELAALVADELASHDVDLRLGRQATEITDTEVVLDTGERLPADLVLVSIGVRPETTLAEAAGIAVGERGGVVVDDAMRTSAPDVFAVGDMVEKRDGISGAASLIPLANLANKQGRRAADAIAGVSIAQRSSARTNTGIGTAVVQVFGLTAASTGLNRRRAEALGLPHVSVHTHPSSHAGYYPGAKQMHLSLLVDPITAAILGAQGVGAEGVERRIDVIATAIAGGLSAIDLIDLELAYAPPYGSAKDPVNQLGYVAEGVLSTDRTVPWDAATDVLEAGGTLVDVRTAGEFRRGSIPGAVNIPVDDLRTRHSELGTGPVTVYCQVGQRGHVATRLLSQLGYDVANLDGGWLTWSAGQRAEALAEADAG